MNAKEIHKLLSDQGVRIFSVRIQSSYGLETEYWIHPSQTVQEWRLDVAAFFESKFISEDDLLNEFHTYMRGLGYIEMMDVVADTFEGEVRIVHEGEHLTAKMVPDPDHREDVTGFGHHGWESK
ncbi:MAG: hypothetical protein M0R80_01490 [Proteobacteria bacterium]|nr:hypothetical protein [Pseudomonadota bacterium]